MPYCVGSASNRVPRRRLLRLPCRLAVRASSGPQCRSAHPQAQMYRWSGRHPTAQTRINKNRQRNRTVRPSDRTATHATAAPAGTEGRCLQAHGRFPAPGQTIREIDRPPSLRPRKFYQPGPKKSIAAGLSFCRSAVCRSDRAQRTPSTGGPADYCFRKLRPGRLSLIGSPAPAMGGAERTGLDRGPSASWGPRLAERAHRHTIGRRTRRSMAYRATNQAVDGVWT